MAPKLPLALALAALAASAVAVQPQFLRISSMRDFMEGELNGLSVDSSGRLSLAPQTRTGPDLDAPVVWAVAVDAQGSIFAGTGNDGRILRIEGEKAATFFDAPEPEVQALAFGPDGRLFAATNPDGRVYAIDKAGKAVEFFNPEERYIWALAFDGQGRLWVATGGEGKIYRVDGTGQSTTILTSQDSHITALAVAPAGGVFAGSSPSGLIYFIDARDNARVLYDSNYREVKALLPMPNGSVYAALVDGRSEIPTPRPTPSPSPGATPAPEAASAQGVSIEVFAFPTAPRANETPRGGSGPARGAVYLVTSLGDADQLWSGDESPFFVFKRRDAVLFGTGSNGRIYEVRDDRTFTLVRSLPQDQLTAAITMASGDTVIASANPGKLQYLSTRTESRGVFTSAARDFDAVAQVGALEAGGQGEGVSLEIRTGNAAVPDTTWTDWQKVAAGKAPENSPQARFAQIRASLTTAPEGSSLSWLQLAYVQRNTRPLIRELTLYPAGEAFQKGAAGGGSAEPEIAGLESGAPEIKPPSAGGGRSTDAPSLGRKVFFRSLRTMTWRAEDSNGDDLRYDVSYRLEDGTAFTRLRDGLQEPIFTWDTATVPSGRYVLRVVARDQISNPEGRGLSYEKDSEAFDVDNDPPTIKVTMKEGTARVVMSDAINSIRKAEWAPEAGSWTEMTPLDGLADSREEEFEIRLPAPAPAAIVIRATDAFGNVASTRFPIRK